MSKFPKHFHAHYIILSSKRNCFPSLMWELKQGKCGSYSLLYPQHQSPCLAHREPANPAPSEWNRKWTSRERTGFLKVAASSRAGQQLHLGLSEFLVLSVPTITCCCANGWQHPKVRPGWEQGLEIRGREVKRKPFLVDGCRCWS